jgi:hypothetical protein
MARYHGKAARMYMSVSGAAEASPMASVVQWTLDMKTERKTTTSQGDANVQYVQGFPDIQGTLNGNWDDSEDKLFAAKDSTTGVKIYLYPSLNAPTKYWYGTAWVDASIDASATDVVKFTGTFAAAGDWGRK